MIDLLRPDYPARIGRADGLVLIDFVGLVPEVHGDPNADVLKAIDQASRHERLAMLIRVRDSRPPPPDSRAAIMDRLTAIQSKIACVSICLEGAGFRAVAFRSFVSAARLIGVVKVPVDIRPDLEAATALLLENYAVEPALRAEVERFFASAEGQSEAH